MQLGFELGFVVKFLFRDHTLRLMSSLLISVSGPFPQHIYFFGKSGFKSESMKVAWPSLVLEQCYKTKRIIIPPTSHHIVFSGVYLSLNQWHQSMTSYICVFHTFPFHSLIRSISDLIFYLERKRIKTRLTWVLRTVVRTNCALI